MEKNIKNIYENWHFFAKNRQTEKLIELYDEDATFESPLVTRIRNSKSGILKGKKEILKFLEEGTKRRPNELVRWYRNDEYYIHNDMLIWEYPRETPEGDQVDILELEESFMQLYSEKSYTTLWKNFNQSSINGSIFYNTERLHSSRYCFGKTPTQTFADGKNLAQEKYLNSFFRQNTTFKPSDQTEEGSAEKQPVRESLTDENNKALENHQPLLSQNHFCHKRLKKPNLSD